MTTRFIKIEFDLHWINNKNVEIKLYVEFSTEGVGKPASVKSSKFTQLQTLKKLLKNTRFSTLNVYISKFYLIF